jgi:hypothetical protein
MLQITKVNGKLGIDTTNTKMYITQPKADFEIEKKDAKLQIRTDQLKVIIDQQECFNETGLMDYMTLTEQNANIGKQGVAEGIDRIVAEGNILAAVENKIDAVAQISLNNMEPRLDYNFGLTPKSRPRISYTGGTVDIQVEDGYVKVHSKPNKPIIEVENGKVEISLLQHPKLEIKFIGNNFDKSI